MRDTIALLLAAERMKKIIEINLVNIQELGLNGTVRINEIMNLVSDENIQRLLAAFSFFRS